MTVRAIGAAVVPPTPLWFWSTTAIATSGGDLLVLPGERDEPRRVGLRDAGLARSPSCRRPSSRRSARRFRFPRATTRRIIDATSCAVRALTAWRMRCGCLLVDDLASGPDDAVDDVRLHQLPAEAERACDHRHLERRDEHPLLSEGHPPGVDVRVDACG